jgi:hypothetical protein
MKKLVRALFIVPVAVALAAVLYLSPSPTAQVPTTDSQECVIDDGAGLDSTAASCGRCGDGSCVPQCGETALSCPKDCGGSES